MNETYLSLGGNVGDRKKNLESALKAIERNCGVIEKLSSIYETAAWGLNDQPSFLNQALKLKTYLEPHALLNELLEIERSLGRQRNLKYGPRNIDIDILFYEKQIISSKGLHIPHPEMQNRKFVLVPLNEIDPEFIHPVFKVPIHQLLLECTDVLEVNKYY